MNPVYLRLAFYIVAPLVAAAGLGTYDAAAGTLTISVGGLGGAAGMAGLLSTAIFAKWGTK